MIRPANKLWFEIVSYVCDTKKLNITAFLLNILLDNETIHNLVKNKMIYVA